MQNKLEKCYFFYEENKPKSFVSKGSGLINCSILVLDV